MWNWYTIEVEQRYQERLQEAEQMRLVHLAEAAGRRPARLRGRMMHWVGSRLVESGRRLQMW